MMNNISNEHTVCSVQKWVKDLFEDTDINIPELEENLDCIELLSRIISINKEAEKDANEIIKTESYLADFYKKKNDEISRSLGTLSMKDLQPNIYDNVKKIASVALHMKLKEPTITNFLLSSADLENKRENLIEQEIINGFTISKFNKKITDVMQKNEILQRDIIILEEKVPKRQAFNYNEQSKFFTNKAEEYKKRTKQIEKYLRSLQWNSSLSHSELVKRSEAIQSLENEVKELATKLEIYDNLPPNEMLTRFKIEEAQTELLRLQKEFNALLNTC